MFDSRWFTDTYDLYRPTITTADTGAQTFTEPDTATESDQPCRLFPGRNLVAFGATGPDVDYDAVLLVPAGADLRPEQKGQQPDHVEIDSRRYVVQAVWDAGGQGLYKKVLLSERRS